MTADVVAVALGGALGGVGLAVGWGLGYRYGRYEMETEIWRVLDEDGEVSEDAES